MADGWSLVGTVIRKLSETLPAPIEKLMSKVYGPGWFSKVKTLATPPPNPAMLRDPQLALKVLWVYRKKAFARVLSGPERELAVGYLRSMRNNWAHFEPITLADARSVAQKAFVLLGALGMPAGDLENLFGEIKKPVPQPSLPSILQMPGELTVQGLQASGFLGFEPIRLLRQASLASVPALAGVYAILRPSENPPAFVEVSSAGHFKDKDPSVPIAWLGDEWVDGAEMLYVGKSVNLKRRVAQLLAFGAGKKVGHWGGRMLWQLADAEDLLVAWKPTETAKPEDVESAMLTLFLRSYGQLPFANLKFS